jgi:hypothetical protein
VYVSGTTKEQLDRVKFEEIQEIYHGSTHHFHIGWANFSDLQQLDWNNESELFLAVLPEGLELTSKVFTEAEELEAHAN